MNDDGYREKYENLKYNFQKLELKYENLERENQKLSSDLDSAEFKIRTELNPRIARERKAYDAFITNPEREEKE